MPTFIEKFEDCSHKETCQVGVERQPVVFSESRGMCFWCTDKAIRKEELAEQETQRRVAARKVRR